MNSDIIIIGGGIIGLTLARELHKNGVKKITILEKGKVGKESSFAAAGMLLSQAEINQVDDFFQFCEDSKKLYPDFAEELLDETDIDIELDKRGTLFTAFNSQDIKEIHNRYEWQKKAGLNVEHLNDKETHKLEPFISPDSIESLYFPDDWQVENRKLIKALEKYAKLNQIKIIENSKAKSLITENRNVKGVKTAEGDFFSNIIILATGAWVSLIKSKDSKLTIPKVKPIRGQMIKFQTAKRLFRHVIYSSFGYLVPRKSGQILAGATTEDVGFAEVSSSKGVSLLKEAAYEIAPSLEALKVEESWYGFRPYTSEDGMPLIGEIANVNNLYISTGHYRSGILLAPISAKILADKILKQVHCAYLNHFSPARFQSAKII